MYASVINSSYVSCLTEIRLDKKLKEARAAVKLWVVCIIRATVIFPQSSSKFIWLFLYAQFQYYFSYNDYVSLMLVETVLAEPELVFPQQEVVVVKVGK